MIRRLITACVLTGMFAAQWAVVPHSHDSSTKPSHDDSPHVHLSFGEHGHSHSHYVDHVHSHHAAKPSDAGAETGTSVTDVEDHDADAVYLAAGDSPSAPALYQKCPDQSPTAQPSVLATEVCDALDCLTTSIKSTSNPFENEAPSCARFLTLRSLRI